jgi:hypothetical protein
VNANSANLNPKRRLHFVYACMEVCKKMLVLNLVFFTERAQGKKKIFKKSLLSPCEFMLCSF